jgi:hypothetical protein
MSQLILVLLTVLLTGCAGMVETTKSAGKSLEASIIEMMSSDGEDESSPPRALEDIVEQVFLTPVWQQKVTEGRGQIF